MEREGPRRALGSQLSELPAVQPMGGKGQNVVYVEDVRGSRMMYVSFGYMSWKKVTTFWAMCLLEREGHWATRPEVSEPG